MTVPAFLAFQPPSAMIGAIAALYLGIGLGVAAWLARRGGSTGAALAAIFAWPLLLSALERTPGAPPARALGPLGAAIDAAFAALGSALSDPAVRGVPVRAEVDGLRQALLRADERLGLVDRLLADTPESDDEEIARSRQALSEARGRAAAEIEAVLSGVVQLRLQIGLLALAGDSGGIAERLGQLRARVRAIEEIDRLGP